MKKLLLSIVLCSISVFTAFSQNVHPDYLDGEIYVRIKKEKIHLFNPINGTLSPNSFNILFENTNPFKVNRVLAGFQGTGWDPLERTLRVRIENPEGVSDLLNSLEKHPWVELAEPVPYLKTDYTPNDLGSNSYNGQYYLWRINAQGAWDISKGDSSIVVAIVDDALKHTHPDLEGNVWINPDEIAGNGIDDDNDGYIDNIYGWDVGDNDNDPIHPNTNFSHGTHVGGCASAQADNGIGIASIGFNVSLMGVKCTENNQSNVNAIPFGYEGISYAARAGAHVINCSWSGSFGGQTGQQVITFARNRNSIVVAAASNDDVNSLRYPAAFSGVIAVASTAINDSKSSFSNFGTWVDISAPGTQIRSTITNDGYQQFSGTSMASPIVAGLLGLMKSVGPFLDISTIESCLINTADDISAINPNYIGELGSGRINAFKAVACVDSFAQQPPIAVIEKSVDRICPTYSIQFFGSSRYTKADSFYWEFEGGNPSSSTAQNPIVTYNNTGSYSVQLITVNKNGSDTLVIDDFAKVDAMGNEIVMAQNFELPDALNNFELSDNSSAYIVFGNYASKNGSAAINFNGSAYGANQTESIILPKTSVKGRENSLFSFDYAYTEWLGNNDSFFIEVSPDNGANWISHFAGYLTTTANPEENFIPNSASEWCQSFSCLAIDLEDYQNTDSILIRFTHQGVNKRNIYLDNFLIDGTCAYLNDRKPMAKFSNTDNDFCTPVQVDFMDESEFYADSVLWLFEGGSPATSNDRLPLVSYNTAGKYDVTLISYNEFGADTLYLDDYFEFEEGVDLQISADKTTMCRGEFVTVESLGADNYVWSPVLSITVLQANQSRVRFSPNNTMTYNVSATKNNGCSASGSFTINVNPKPSTPNIYKVKDSLFSTINDPSLTYSWFKENVLIPNENNPFIKISELGNYKVQIDNEFSCFSQSGNFNVTALSDLKAESSFSIYPNPARNIILLEAELNNSETIIEIISLEGKILMSEKWLNNKQEMNISQLPQGVYIIRVSGNGPQGTNKLIKY